MMSACKLSSSNILKQGELLYLVGSKEPSVCIQIAKIEFASIVREHCPNYTCCIIGADSFHLKIDKKRYCGIQHAIILDDGSHFLCQRWNFTFSQDLREWAEIIIKEVEEVEAHQVDIVRSTEQIFMNGAKTLSLILTKSHLCFVGSGSPQDAPRCLGKYKLGASLRVKHDSTDQFTVAYYDDDDMTIVKHNLRHENAREIVWKIRETCGSPPVFESRSTTTSELFRSLLLEFCVENPIIDREPFLGTVIDGVDRGKMILDQLLLYRKSQSDCYGISPKEDMIYECDAHYLRSPASYTLFKSSQHQRPIDMLFAPCAGSKCDLCEWGRKIRREMFTEIMPNSGVTAGGYKDLARCIGIEAKDIEILLNCFKEWDRVLPSEVIFRHWRFMHERDFCTHLGMLPYTWDNLIRLVESEPAEGGIGHPNLAKLLRECRTRAQTEHHQRTDTRTATSPR